MKISRGKLPLSVIAVVIGAVALAGLFFAEDLRALTGTPILELKACTRHVPSAATTTTSTISSKVAIEEKERYAIDRDFADEDKIAFDRKECRVTDGKWVFNPSVKPLYTDDSCPYIDRQVACRKNGRPDKDYLYWEWLLDDCILPRFNVTDVLEKLRGKRLMFVGDSLQRAQWMSFVCLIQSKIPPEQKHMNSSSTLSVFTAKEYNATVEFYWAPYLVESNSDDPIIWDTRSRVIHIDSVAKHAIRWTDVDILVFNTYVWWNCDHKIKTLLGNFSNGEEGYEEVDEPVAYRLGLRTWANWIDSNVNPNRTRVFFVSASPTHFRSEDWHREDGIKCYNETRPIMERGYWGTGSDRKLIDVVPSVIGRMQVPVTFINITQLSDYRIDGHASVYTTESGGKVLNKKQKSNPRRYADCIHWCLPGVPDTWNRILYAHL